jgi:hypothetical protein
MKSAGQIPAGVLSQQLADAIADRRVRAAVFTSFTFDPGFFELHILPLLFDQSFSQVDKVRRIQLEDAMRSIEHMAVYYDRSALAQDAEPAQLDYRRIDVSRATGCFHPKVVLLLVDDPTGASPEDEFPQSFNSLIVAVMSANVTRAGWWENVECAHIEEVKDRHWRDVRRGRRSRPRRCPFRRDLLDFIRRIADTADPDEDQTALETIRYFLRGRTVRKTFTHASTGGRYRTRLFYGQGRKRFVTWLADMRLYQGWNLEVISPYFDPFGAGPLEEMIEALQPREARVYMPRDHDGTAQVTAETYGEVRELADWSDLLPEITTRGHGGASAKLPPRRVHAKIYRLWHREEGDILIVGSVNLTEAAHSRSDAGNLEAAFLVDISDRGFGRRWWLRRIETEPQEFADRARTEEDGLQPAAIDLSIRFDWASGELAYRLFDPAPGGFEVCETTGGVLFKVARPRRGRWVAGPKDAAEKVRKLLRSTSFLLIKHQKGSWRVLVREEHMGHRPSLLTQLTPEEILEYWSLLTPEQRAAFIEIHCERSGFIEDWPNGRGAKPLARTTLFDRFAGIYHAFGCLRRHTTLAIEEGREREAETRLLGAKYDSLPSLLEKSLSKKDKDTSKNDEDSNKKDEDPIIRYVTFLCARQTRDLLAAEHRAFFRSRRKQAARLEELLAKLPEVRAALPIDQMDGGRAFIDWYEEAFLKPVAPEEVDA